MSDKIDEPRAARPVYGKKRVQVPVQVWMDPRVLNGIDEIVKRSGATRAEVVRDALYTAVWAVIRDGLELRRAPGIPHAELYDAIPDLRIDRGALVGVDEYGLQVDEPSPFGPGRKTAAR
jgi:hypothetical protein